MTAFLAIAGGVLGITIAVLGWLLSRAKKALRAAQDAHATAAASIVALDKANVEEHAERVADVSRRDEVIARYQSELRAKEAAIANHPDPAVRLAGLRDLGRVLSLVPGPAGAGRDGGSPGSLPVAPTS